MWTGVSQWAGSQEVLGSHREAADSAHSQGLSPHLHGSPKKGHPKVRAEKGEWRVRFPVPNESPHTHGGSSPKL